MNPFNRHLRKTLRICLFFFLPLSCFSLFYSSAAASAANPNEAGKTGEFRPWVCLLAPETGANADGYAQEEIESFLCAHAQNFITANDLTEDKKNQFLRYSKPSKQNQKKQKTVFQIFPRYDVSARGITPEEKARLENHEINKWFESRVTIKLKGGYNDDDEAVVREFIKSFRVICPGTELVFDMEAPAANIIIEFPGLSSPTGFLDKIGESIILEDNLRIAINEIGGRLNVATFISGSRVLFIQSQNIKITPQELEFRKKNRLVKICLTDILEPEIRRQVLIHELLHAMGFSGHSPYSQSQLFPIYIPCEDNHYYQSPEPSRELTVLSPLSWRMMEMLYRPEIQQGMTLKEAGETLAKLKTWKNTSPAETEALMIRQRLFLENEKKNLLDILQKDLARKTELVEQRIKWAQFQDNLTRLISTVENTLTPAESAGKSPEELIALNLLRAKEGLARFNAEDASFASPKLHGHEKEKKLKELKSKRGEYEESVLVWETLEKDWVWVKTQLPEVTGEILKMVKREEAQQVTLRRLIRRLMALGGTPSLREH